MYHRDSAKKERWNLALAASDKNLVKTHIKDVNISMPVEPDVTTREFFCGGKLFRVFLGEVFGNRCVTYSAMVHHICILKTGLIQHEPSSTFCD